jgi:hypothetical protein
MLRGPTLPRVVPGESDDGVAQRFRVAVGEQKCGD